MELRRLGRPVPVAILALLLLAGGRSGRAADYGMFLDVDSEEELVDLYAAQEIDQEEYEALVELINEGVDLNTASRDELYALPNLTYADVDAILAYRQEAGEITDPAVLVPAKVLSEQKLAAIAAFLEISDAQRSWTDFKGGLRYRTTYVAGDQQAPSMVLGARVSTLKHLDVGLVEVLTRERVRDVRYDPNRDALSAKAPIVIPALPPPKLYAQWKTEHLNLIAGSYRIGFGQRLVFDNTGQYTPNGIKIDDIVFYQQDLGIVCRETEGETGGVPCGGTEDVLYEYQSSDYKWIDRLRGAAAGYRDLDLDGRGWQAYGFFSWQTRGIYQYEIYDRDRCEDPRDDTENTCGSPPVYRRDDDILAPSTKYKFLTLPDMYNETLGGGNFTWYFNRRTHVGVTGYGAGVQWLVDGLDLDFQEWSRTPYGGAYGAVGADAAWGSDFLDLFLELARSFDHQPEGGGYAAIVRATGTWRKQEFEAALRYYDRNYANPYARPIAAADEFEGLRARDEYGLQLKYTGEIGDLDLRALADFWVQPYLSTETGYTAHSAPKIRMRVRGAYQVETWFKPGLWLEYQDKDLSQSGRGSCYELAYDEPIADEPQPCTGEKFAYNLQLGFKPFKRLSITTKFQHSLVDDSREIFKTEKSFRQDVSAWLVVAYRPIEALSLRFRVRYLNQDVAHSADDYLEHSVWAYAEATYWYERILKVKLRYEFWDVLDNRSSTKLRSPNPSHWLRLELEWRF
jgi:hypothetical protein